MELSYSRRYPAQARKPRRQAADLLGNVKNAAHGEKKSMYAAIRGTLWIPGLFKPR